MVCPMAGIGLPVPGQLTWGLLPLVSPLPGQLLCPQPMSPTPDCFLSPSPPQDDPVTNLNNAFEVAEKYLDIPKMLDAEGQYVLLVQ